MQIRFDTGIEHVTLSERCRYELSDIQIVPSKNGVWAVATNGRALAVVPHEAEDVTKPLRIPSALLGKKRRQRQLTSDDGDMWRNSDGLMARSGGGRFPNCAAVIPKDDIASRLSIHLSAGFLSGLAKALNEHDDDDCGVTLFVKADDPEAAIVVSGDGCFGVLMPRGYEGERDKHEKQLRTNLAAHMQEFLTDYSRVESGRSGEDA